MLHPNHLVDSWFLGHSQTYVYKPPQIGRTRNDKPITLLFTTAIMENLGSQSAGVPIQELPSRLVILRNLPLLLTSVAVLVFPAALAVPSESSANVEYDSSL